MTSPNGSSQAPSEQLKIVIVGHVDHGKSTFVGRLFHDTGSLPEGKLEQLQKVAERRGVPFEWANLMDALQSERDQNITIDTAQIWFHTKRRQYVIIDAPGHKEFLKNMVTGAANAEAALLLIDAHEGVQENSRRHGYLLNLLGIRQIAVLVNKMDLENYSEARFNQIEAEYRAWLKTVGVEPKLFVPIAAKHGDNIAVAEPQNAMVVRADRARDPGCLPRLRADRTTSRLRFPIQDIYRFDERRILAGRVEAGSIKVGRQAGVFAHATRPARLRPSNAGTPRPATRLWRRRIGRHHPDRADFRRRGARLPPSRPPRLSSFPASKPGCFGWAGNPLPRARPIS